MFSLLICVSGEGFLDGKRWSQHGARDILLLCFPPYVLVVLLLEINQLVGMYGALFKGYLQSLTLCGLTGVRGSTASGARLLTCGLQL
jgi:hypothetical protein